MTTASAQQTDLTAPTRLDEWLLRIERSHPKTIELGLDRVARVRDRLGISKWCPIITVGGTNGKGSTCAMLEAVLRSAGYRVGLYTSPHLLAYNERVRIDGRAVDDAALIEGFEAVDVARREAGETVPLTYFEFGTLGAWFAFSRAHVDALVLEIGLGGRLDAVNAFEPDCSILTSVALDHQDYLGDTREQIGWEKAHIFRAGRPAICADPDPPQSVLDHAAAIGADLQRLGRDFGYDGDAQQWRFWGRQGTRAGLAYPALRGTNQLLNASAVLAALDAMRLQLPVSANAIRVGLASVELPARFQVLPGRPAVILDVAHNPHAAAVLAANLGSMPPAPSTIAVFGMLHDKDIVGVCRALKGAIDAWHVAGLPGPRGADGPTLERAILAADPIAEVVVHADIGAALAAARNSAELNDRIVVFGSFLTVADAMAALARGAPA